MTGHLESGMRTHEAIQRAVDAKAAVKTAIDALWELRATLIDADAIDAIDRFLTVGQTTGERPNEELRDMPDTELAKRLKDAAWTLRRWASGSATPQPGELSITASRVEEAAAALSAARAEAKDWEFVARETERVADIARAEAMEECARWFDENTWPDARRTARQIRALAAGQGEE